MTKARELAELIGVSGTSEQVLAGRKNLIINGAMQVWQRGTTVQTASGYVNDRFKAYSTNSGVANYALQAVQTSDSPFHSGKCAELHLTNTGGGIDMVSYGQRIEASSLGGIESGSTMTFSCYVKRSQAADGNFKIYVRSPLNGVDSYQSGFPHPVYETAVSVSSSVTFNSLSTDWQRITHTFTATDAFLTNGGQILMTVGGTDNNVTNTNALLRTTGWQLEVGSVATPFEHRSYGEELALCQRYYNKCVSGQYQSVGLGYYIATTQVRMNISLPVSMRTSPSVESSSGTSDFRIEAGSTDYFNGGWNIVADGTQNVMIYATNGVSGTLQNTGAVSTYTTTAYIAFDAEL